MKVEKDEEQQEPTPEQVQSQHLLEIVVNMQKAEHLARHFREKTIGKDFTLMSLARILQQNPSEVERQFNSLMPYGFIHIVSRHGGIPVFRIMLSSEKRIESFDQLIAQYNHQIVYLQNVKEIIVQQMIEEKNQKENKHLVN